MGRTVPSFRMVLAQEKKEWKAYRDVLGKNEKKAFDDMWDIPRLYVSACSNSYQLVPLQPIVISILFHHYKELLECKREVKELGTKVNVKEKDTKYSAIKEEEEEQEGQVEELQEIGTILDSFFVKDRISGI